ncbi:MAG: glycosyltransferase family 4 protein [Syntrophobacteraceae bacterium]
MKTVLTIFLVSLCLALLLTPLATRIARRFDLVDRPSGRKIHTRPIPRIGGVAIFFAFFAPFTGTLVYTNDLIAKIHSDPALFLVVIGAAIVFLMGLADDLFRLHPMLKFSVQAVAAFLAYTGGLSISQLQLPWTGGVDFGWLSLTMTIFWFLLVINAINLIDGLDGLAAGVCFFASLTLLLLSLLGGRYLAAAGLAALAGACLGFLRYNFNPASIFMGDSGSYFLGYMLASLSIVGSMKSQTTVAVLIPVISLGLPLIDTVLATIRRFLIGKEIFQPDKSHIHHRLLKMGFSHRKTVLLLYAATIFLGFFALMLVNAQDQTSAIVLLLLGLTLAIGIHKLGYLEYLAVDKVFGYIQDVTDVMGLNKERRTFLNHQIAINEAVNAEELWDRIIEALELLRIDRAEIRFNGISFELPADCTWCGRDMGEITRKDQYRVMSLDLPLSDTTKSYGTLHLEKDLAFDPVRHYTLRRIEHLRRSVVRKLIIFDEKASFAKHLPPVEHHTMPEPGSPNH